MGEKRQRERLGSIAAELIQRTPFLSFTFNKAGQLHESKQDFTRFIYLFIEKTGQESNQTKYQQIDYHHDRFGLVQEIPIILFRGL